MATTTNFGWETPDDTDFVKDGAAAIRTLGSSIDTSLVDLKGGTTGQVLSKTSATDMDFTWTSPNPGDITAVTAGTGITGGGTSGDVTVSFDQANFGGGQFAAGKNKILNGDFNINQRSFSSTTTSGTFGFDRWLLASSGGTVTYSAQTFTIGAAPVAGYEGTNFARILTSGQSIASDRSALTQRMESVRTFAGQTVTVSFWAKAGSGTPSVGANLGQNFGTGGSSAVQVAGQKATISTSWARYSFTFSVPSISGKTIGPDNSLQLRLWTSSGADSASDSGSIGIQNNTIDFWGVQVEAGSVASPFQTATGTIQGELAACQRYYFRTTAGNVYGYVTGFGSANSTTSAKITIPTPTLRRSATSIDYANVILTDSVGGFALTALTANGFSAPQLTQLDATVASGLTQYRPYAIFDNNVGTGFIGISADL